MATELSQTRVSPRRLRLGTVTLAQLVVLGLGLLLWELAVRAGSISTLYLPSPIAIADALVTLVKSGELAHHTSITLAEFVVGYAAAVVVGIGGGLIIALVPWFERFAAPFVAACMSVPKVAIVPLLALWLGIGFSHKAVIVFLFAVFQIFYSTVAGVKQAQRSHLRVAWAFGARSSQTIRKVLLPSAVPTIFASLRVSASVGLVGALFAEMLSSKSGLGNLISRAGAALDTPTTFALVLIVTVLAVAMVATLGLAERTLFLRWRSA